MVWGTRQNSEGKITNKNTPICRRSQNRYTVRWNVSHSFAKFFGLPIVALVSEIHFVYALHNKKNQVFLGKHTYYSQRCTVVYLMRPNKRKGILFYFIFLYSALFWYTFSISGFFCRWTWVALFKSRIKINSHIHSFTYLLTK